MDYYQAEIIALNALSFVAGNEKYLELYLNLSGINIKQLKETTSNPKSMTDILASIIDFLLQNEKYLVEFSDQFNINPSDIQLARQYFPGGAIINYE